MTQPDNPVTCWGCDKGLPFTSLNGRILHYDNRWTPCRHYEHHEPKPSTPSTEKPKTAEEWRYTKDGQAAELHTGQEREARMRARQEIFDEHQNTPRTPKDDLWVLIQNHAFPNQDVAANFGSLLEELWEREEGLRKEMSSVATGFREASGVYGKRIENQREQIRQIEVKNKRAIQRASDLEDELKTVRKKLKAFECLEEHLPAGYDLGDDATAELAIKLAEAESQLAAAKKELALLATVKQIWDNTNATTQTLVADLTAANERIRLLEQRKDDSAANRVNESESDKVFRQLSMALDNPVLEVGAESSFEVELARFAVERLGRLAEDAVSADKRIKELETDNGRLEAWKDKLAQLNALQENALKNCRTSIAELAAERDKALQARGLANERFDKAAEIAREALGDSERKAGS